MSTRSSARDHQFTQNQIYKYDENTHIDYEPADSQIIEVGAEVLLDAKIKREEDVRQRWTKPMVENQFKLVTFIGNTSRPR